MKNTQCIKTIAAFILGIFLIPMVSFAENATPTIKLLGVQEITASKSVAHVLVTTHETLTDRARVYVEFTDIENDETHMTSYATYSIKGESADDFWMSGLVSGHTYEYRAVMEFNGHSYKTALKKFTQGNEGSSTTTSTTQNTSNNSTTTTSSTIVTTPTKTTDSSILGSLFGSSTTKVTTDLQNKVMTGGVASKNGVAIAITNEQARVDQDDAFTYTVRYQNGRTTSLRNAKMVITLPDAYEFVSSATDFEYNTKTNSISYTMGRIAPSTTKSFTFKARALGESSGEVKTSATIYFEGGTLTAADRDSYHTGSKSALGASVFGVGFFPQTLTGWLLIIGLITIVIIISRRYTQVPVQPQKTA